MQVKEAFTGEIMATSIEKAYRSNVRRVSRKFAPGKRILSALILLALMFGASACSVESAATPGPAASASASPAASAPVVNEPVATPTVSAVPFQNQAIDEREGFYSEENIKWVSNRLPDGSMKTIDPNGAAGNVASNLNQFLQRVPIEWTNSPSKAYPADTPTKKVFPKSSMYVSTSIPEYQAKKLFSAITNAVDLWRDVVIMADFRFVEFSEDGKTARVPVASIGASASPKNGLVNGLKDKHAGADSGDILFTKEGDNWKISGIGGYYGKYNCLWEC